MYVDTARPIVDKVLEGYNGTILAYGQTGTGKTYTMSGNPDSPQTKGIIPNTFAHIFGHIARAKENQKFLVRVSYMEIYNEEVRDLLGKEFNKSLEVKERADIGVFVKDLSGYVVHNADDLDNIMKLGNKNRVVGATKMNSESSRSHAIFSITIESSETDENGKQYVKMGKLQLVDLAGSERQSKTQSSGLRLKEATKINLSLSVLGNVISALVDGKSTHIPYRNSKLTRLLQDSLGGNSKTVMCASISPADSNYVETISTLRYACRAKSIQNLAHVNEEPKDALLRHFQEEIKELKRQLEEGTFVNGICTDEDDEEEIDDDDEEEEEEIEIDEDKEKERLEKKDKKRRERAKEKKEKADAEKELLEKKAIENEQEIKRAKYVLHLSSKFTKKYQRFFTIPDLSRISFAQNFHHWKIKFSLVAKTCWKKHRHRRYFWRSLSPNWNVVPKPSASLKKISRRLKPNELTSRNATALSRRNALERPKSYNASCRC